ncbi:hypothetical protein M758_9G038200 [Ceratodon purpureus]|nr:hypothetical protein M758_9G038200 [Ceratodon purpureus]
MAAVEVTRAGLSRRAELWHSAPSSSSSPLTRSSCSFPSVSMRRREEQVARVSNKVSQPLRLHNELKCSFVGSSMQSSIAGEGMFSARKSLERAGERGEGRGRRGVVTMVIPFQRGDARQQPPPDLPSYLFKNRIVFLGMSLVPAVTELIMAELLYLQYEDPEKSIYMYINSTGTTKDGEKLGYETEAFAIYDTMKYVRPPIFTLCVGNAWGEAALLLSAGSKGNRACLPSATIMLKQPIAQFRGQATDIDIARKEVRNVKDELVTLISRCTGQTVEKINDDIRRPKYFKPDEAVDYGIIDKVLYGEGDEKRSIASDLKKAQLI